MTDTDTDCFGQISTNNVISESPETFFMVRKADDAWWWHDS